jgi:hypothetical protein
VVRLVIGQRSTGPSFSSWAIAYANVDLPVPGRPVISNGRRSMIATLTSSTSRGSDL